MAHVTGQLFQIEKILPSGFVVGRRITEKTLLLIKLRQKTQSEFIHSLGLLLKICGTITGQLLHGKHGSSHHMPSLHR